MEDPGEGGAVRGPPMKSLKFSTLMKNVTYYFLEETKFCFNLIKETHFRLLASPASQLGMIKDLNELSKHFKHFECCFEYFCFKTL